MLNVGIMKEKYKVLLMIWQYLVSDYLSSFSVLSHQVILVYIVNRFS